MKKIFTLICAAVLMCGFASAQKVQRFKVTNATEFNNALTEIATLEKGSTAYVYIQGLIDAKTLKNDASGKMQPTLRNIHFIGVNDEETGERATLKMEMQLPANNTEADGFSLHYENLRLMQTQGVWGNSKHLMNFKDTLKHYIDTLEFVNCELTELCRSLYRAEAQNKNTDAGTMKVFRMENCVVHNGFRQASAMPAIYMAQPVNEMIFKNNTFYDLTYLNGIVSFGTMTENTGRQAVKVVFENNTVCAWSKASLLGYAGGVSTESEFHIKNNIIVQPNWIDEMNGRFGDTNGAHAGVGIYGETDEANGFLTQDSVDARIAKGVNLTNLDGGLVQLENNILYGYKYQNMNDAIDMGNIIPIGNDENEEAEFSFLTMEDAEFAWTDFAGAQQDMFQINKSHKVFTAGKNGAPIGDENNYTDQVIKIVTVTTHVEGSNSATVSVNPAKDAYTTGEKVTLTANTNGSLNTFKGWSNGMTDPTIEVELTDNLDITATFEEIPYIAVWNLDDIAANNVTKVPPVAPNYGNKALSLSYARYFVVDSISFEGYRYGAEASEAYGGSKAAIQTRNNKVSGDVRNCFIIQTPNTEFLKEEGGKADYLFLEIAEAQKASKLKFFVASDNVPYNNYAISYTTDGENWTDAATFTMVDRAGTNEWYPVEANLPELPAGAKVRIKGVENEGHFVSTTFSESGNAVDTEFLFVTEIILSENEGGQQQDEGTLDLIDKFTSCWQETETITHNADRSFTYAAGQWGGAAAWIGGEDWSAYSQLVFEFAEPTPCDAQVIIQYADNTSTKNMVVDGATKIVTALEAGKVSVNQVALQLAAGATITVTKAYLLTEAAGIQNVNFVQNKNAVRYNLSGQKVDDSYKGVVIVNGKKMFVK